ncbi:MAG: helix-hairpin-helix domain-containing protein [Chitinophagaceae bacterium]
MKSNFLHNSLLLFLTLLTGFTAAAQEKEKTFSTLEQQLENMAEANDAVPEDDALLQQLNYLGKHPLNINTAGAEELAALNMITGLQIQQLLAYRKLFGRLVDKYELQAIPGWDLFTIRKLLPYVAVSDDKNLVEKLRDRWTGGDQQLMARYARVLEKSKGYDKPLIPGANYYTGSRDKILLRYNYNYKNLLQWGLLADKDAGEQFFKGAQKQGFDFYSFHFFARRLGTIKALAMGDFTVNLGQGLLQWQSLAFKKSADVMAVKRQSATLRPYHSAGEYNFHRGIGVTLQRKNWEATLFASFRKISANINADSVNDDGVVSSFLVGGYHRTAAEIKDRNSLEQTAGGANIKYQGAGWHAGINAVYYHFAQPVQRSAEPYNIFALQGRTLTAASIDYSYTWRNIHLFGESAADHALHKAFIHGAVISLDAKAAVSLVHRKIDRAYQSVNANAFTENAFPVNENGLYAGLTLRPLTAWRLDAYADVFQLPWLKYRVDAPSTGKDYFIQVTYTPGKQAEISARYKNEIKMINRTAANTATATIDRILKKNLRLQTSITASRELRFGNRLEAVWYDDNGPAAGQGFLTYLETTYKPAFLHWSGNMRLLYFETTSYNERIYAYESDLPYNFSIPAYYDKGMRYCFNINWDADRLIKTKKWGFSSLNIGAKWAQTIYANEGKHGSALDEISGNSHTEIKVQVILNL